MGFGLVRSYHCGWDRGLETFHRIVMKNGSTGPMEDQTKDAAKLIAMTKVPASSAGRPVPMVVQRKDAWSVIVRTRSLVTIARARMDCRTLKVLVSPLSGFHPCHARIANSCEVTDRLLDVMRWGRGVLQVEQT